MFVRLRFRFGVLAALCVALSVFGSCNVIERTSTPAFEARIDRIEGGFAEATVTGHGRTFAATLGLDLFTRSTAHAGSTVTVHCEASPDGAGMLCSAGSRTGRLLATFLFGLVSLIAAAWLLRPWLPAPLRGAAARP
jgi:hypothetical protein